MQKVATSSDIELLKKMPILLEALLDIERAKTEDEAIIVAILRLEQLGFNRILISTVRTIGTTQYIVGDPKLTNHLEWKRVAERTQRALVPATDVLAIALSNRTPIFIADSRVDSMCDTALCREFNVISQYVMPLATDSMPIGTLQIDMGNRTSKPGEACMVLDGLAAHLSIAIERHRTLGQLHTAHSELMSKSKMIAYEAAAANIMHSLGHSVGDYAGRLRRALENPTINTNKDAADFLNYTRRCVSRWIGDIEANTVSFRRKEIPEPHDVDRVLQEVIDTWFRKASYYNCALIANCLNSGLKVRVRLGALKELLSCLVVNAIEASARKVTITVSRHAKLTADTVAKDFVEILVRDDGDGVPKEYESTVFELGWTTKIKKGHGMGLTIVSLLTKEMGGGIQLRSFGKSANQNFTEFAVFIPEYVETNLKR